MDNVSPGKLAIVIGGGVAFLFSFLSWWSYSYVVSSSHYSAWSDGLFGVATWVPLFGLVGALAVALPAFANVKLPEKVLDFTVDQLVLVCGVFCTLISLGYIVGTPEHASIGIGLIFSFLGSAAMVVGWFLDKQGVGVKVPGQGQATMSPEGYQVAQGYAPPPAQPAPPAPPEHHDPTTPPPEFSAPIAQPPPSETYIPGVTEPPPAAAQPPPAFDPDMNEPNPPPETGSF